jgi:hypothetical protein
MMANQNLVMFIQNSLQQGYDINSIRNQLIQQGYSQYDVDAAIGFLYGRPQQVHHTISLSKSAIIGIIAAILGVALTAVLAYMLVLEPKAPSKLLDFETSPLKTAVKPGETMSFTIRLFNMGSTKRYDVSVSSIIYDEINKMVAKKEDTFAVEKRTTETMQITIPATAKPGTYSVKSTASYPAGKAVSSFEFSIFQDSTSPTCTDNKQNQGEAGVDCGGPCKPCATCHDKIMNQGETGIDCGGPCQTDCCQNGIQDENEDGVDCGGPCKACSGCQCDDGNPCTNDLCTDGVCSHTGIKPCCGNNICEEAEEECPDCTGAEESPKDIIERARQTSSSEPEAAAKICDSLREPRDKDRCFEISAKNSNQSRYCTPITSSANRDACYMHFAMRFDYTVCDKVESIYLKKSCDSLKYIKASS